MQDVTELLKLAEQGDVEAQYNLGNCYYDGDGVEKDYVQAVRWFIKAATQGYTKAQFDLSACYYNGEGVKRDYVQAVRWLTKAAEQGNVEAQYELCACYCNGEGVEKNYAQALHWFTKASKQSDADAENMLNHIFELEKSTVTSLDLQRIQQEKKEQLKERERQLNLELERSKQRLVDLSSAYANGEISKSVFVATSKQLESKIELLEKRKATGDFSDSFLFQSWGNSHLFDDTRYTSYDKDSIPKCPKCENPTEPWGLYYGCRDCNILLSPEKGTDLQYALDDDKVSTYQSIIEKPSGLLYLLPLFFGILGGVIGYLFVKDKDKDMADGIMSVGVMVMILQIILFVFFGLPIIFPSGRY